MLELAYATNESIFDILSAEPSFTNALDSFNLSPVDRDETLRVKKDGWEDTLSEAQELAKTTQNVGIQYLMVSEWDTILHVLVNDSLSPKVIVMLLDVIKSAGPWTQGRNAPRPFTLTTYRAVEYLLRSKVVAAEPHLFSRAWEALEDFEEGGGLEAYASSYCLMFYNALYYHSTKAVNDDMIMSIETLLFILGRLHKFPEGSVSTLMQKLISSIIEDRWDEIQVWVENNMPDYVDLPLSWLYEVLDLHMEELSS